jgi:hypothetical protein
MKHALKFSSGVCGRMHAWFTVYSYVSLIRNNVMVPYNRDQHVYVIAVLKKHENIKHV